MDDLPVAGRELASRILPAGDRLLMASFVTLSHGEPAIHLAAVHIAQDGSMSLPSTPFAFDVADIGTVRAMAAQATRVLPLAQFSENGWCALGRDGDLVATATRTPDGETYASLGWADGSGICAVPATSAALFVDVLADAERQLVSDGLVTLSPDLTN